MIFNLFIRIIQCAQRKLMLFLNRQNIFHRQSLIKLIKRIQYYMILHKIILGLHQFSSRFITNVNQ